MERTQQDWEHEYLAIPMEYNIGANENHSTYDQFIQLRDTLIFTWKYYNDKASRKLCVWDKWDGSTTNTIEVWLPNCFKQQIEPDWTTNPIEPGVLWSYVTKIPAAVSAQIDQSILQEIWPLNCYITKDGHYRLVHKEEVLPTTAQSKVYCYIDVYRKNGQGVYEIAIKWGIAVFDWQASWTLTWNTSGTDPNGSCSISFTLGKLFQKVTAFWYMERDLLKWDILALRMKDADVDADGKPQWNDLTLQNWSNYWSIEYLDLPYNI